MAIENQINLSLSLNIPIFHLFLGSVKYSLIHILGFMAQAKVRVLNGKRIMHQCWFWSAEHGLLWPQHLHPLMNDGFVLLVKEYGQRQQQIFPALISTRIILCLLLAMHGPCHLWVVKNNNAKYLKFANWRLHPESLMGEKVGACTERWGWIIGVRRLPAALL